ncbi:glycoside hydrolase family 3 N-terminal domain-containing protein [Nocardiopsis suaedae]|uniref:Glycoside hydrolase family 3 protein n=1 Tax=Nocardiopsis suaedae TaxID=3018444 RepID=A0ABT4TLB2_9ACTN|nr:glycoside hydrolase family 3 N-terminal domain-containing protein [Nocardiopsis suaedae]MDA2805175.1 glycoside hydrolase family 3 protein [Nocardiopsis suaedae]
MSRADAERAARVLMPGFLGTAAPPWLLEACRDGLGAVLYFAQNLDGDPAALSRELHGARGRLLIACDEEGGPVSRFHPGGASPHPAHGELGAAGDTAATRAAARSIGDLLRRAGVDAALAPVVDVASDPRNPVIGPRAFSDRPGAVAEHGAAFTAGLQDVGRAAAAKHFPGHGDTRTDSHVGLPVIGAGEGLLRERDLVPFAAAVRAGVDMVMSGHIVVPAVDAAPASVSPRWYRLLREELGFEGVAVTDALDMKGLAVHTGEADTVRAVARGAVEALAAGADLLCLGNPATAGGTGREAYLAAHAAVLEAVDGGRVPRARLAEAADRVDALADALPR